MIVYSFERIVQVLPLLVVVSFKERIIVARNSIVSLQATSTNYDFQKRMYSCCQSHYYHPRPLFMRCFPASCRGACPLHFNYRTKRATTTIGNRDKTYSCALTICTIGSTDAESLTDGVELRIASACNFLLFGDLSWL
jgi:hypothetical protein